MRVAWFQPRPAASHHPVDDTASLVAELRRTHTVARYDERRAHDFVWQHARQPFDVCVYELTDSPDAAFVHPYLLHFSGIARLRTTTRSNRLRLPALASRLVVVADAGAAATLQDAWPDARLRSAPLGVPPPANTSSPASPGVVVVMAAGSRAASIERAAARAGEAGARFELRRGGSAEAVAASDVVIALDWPPSAEPPGAALQAMAARRVVIVYETQVTAAWPAFDPQTWQPRGFTPHAEPAVVSIDPMDEEHSLMLALRRLTADAPFRERLGAAAHEWWRTHATPAQAAMAWEPLLAEASRLTPPHPYTAADGSERTRAILDEFGVAVDFLETRRHEEIEGHEGG